MPIQVKEVLSWWDREVFIRIPRCLYHNDSAFCMPLLRDQRRFMAPDHPFRQHGDAKMFIVYRNHVPVGRAMASYDPNLAKQEGQAVGYVGLFECIQDQGVCNALLDACQAWLKLAHEVVVVRGPVDYSINYLIGMYLGPYHEPQRYMLNYNPPYYPVMWEAYGFQKKIDLFSWWGKTPDKLDRWVEKVRRIAQDSTVTIRPLTGRTFRQDLMAAKEFIGGMLEGQCGHVAATNAEHERFVDDHLHMPPELILFAEDHDKLVGLMLTVPDMSEVIRPLNGRFFHCGLPLGWLKYTLARRHIKTARVDLLGVLPEYRFDGIAERLVMETLSIGREKFGFEATEIGWTFEDNVAMVNSIEKLGMDVKKTYRLFEKQLP